MRGGRGGREGEETVFDVDVVDLDFVSCNIFVIFIFGHLLGKFAS